MMAFRLIAACALFFVDANHLSGRSATAQVKRDAVIGQANACGHGRTAEPRMGIVKAGERRDTGHGATG